MPVNLHTTHYRFGVDSGTESSHGWHANEDANPAQGVIAVDTTFLLRFQVQETGATLASNIDCRFQCALNGGAFQDITAASTIVKAVTTSVFADAASLTKRLTGTGTFESSGQGGTHDGLSGGAQNDIAASGCSETECALQIVSANVVHNDVITFRLTSPDTTITNDIVPTLTVSEASPQTITCDTPITTEEAFGTAILDVPRTVGKITQPQAGPRGTGRRYGAFARIPGQTITCTAIDSAEAFGTPSVIPLIAPSAIASTETFGTASVVPLIAPSAIASVEAHGTPSNLNFTLTMTSIAPDEAFGTASVGSVISPSGIASEEAHGTPSQLSFIVYPSSIASEEAFGTLVLGLSLLPSAMASTETFGTTLLAQSHKITQPRAGPIGTGRRYGVFAKAVYIDCTGIASTEAFGTLEIIIPRTVGKITQPMAADTVGRRYGSFARTAGGQTITCSSISTGEAFGTSTLNFILYPSSMTTGEAFGTPSLAFLLFPSAIASAEAFGTTSVGSVLAPSGIATGEAFGTLTLLVHQSILVSAMASLEAFGSTVVIPNQFITASAMASTEAFGTDTLTFILYPSDVASLEAFGTTLVRPNQFVTCSSLGPDETFGSTTLNTGQVQIIASAITSAEAFGSAQLNVLLYPSSVVSAEAFGTFQLNFMLTASGIATGEAMGATAVGAVIGPTGIASAEAFGDAFMRTLQLLHADAIATQEAFGTLSLTHVLLLSGVPSTEAFGVATLQLYILPSGIASTAVVGTPAQVSLALLLSGVASGEQFGTLSLTVPTTLTVSGIASEEVIGSTVINTGQVQLIPSGIASTEVFGTLQLNQYMIPVAIPSGEAIGLSALRLHLVASGIASTALVGTPQQVYFSLYPEALFSQEAFGTLFLDVPMDLPVPAIPSGEGFGGTHVVLVSVQFPVKIFKASSWRKFVIAGRGRAYTLKATSRAFTFTAKGD